LDGQRRVISSNQQFRSDSRDSGIVHPLLSNAPRTTRGGRKTDTNGRKVKNQHVAACRQTNTPIAAGGTPVAKQVASSPSVETQSPRKVVPEHHFHKGYLLCHVVRSLTRRARRELSAAGATSAYKKINQPTELICFCSPADPPKAMDKLVYSSCYENDHARRSADRSGRMIVLITRAADTAGERVKSHVSKS